MTRGMWTVLVAVLGSVGCAAGTDVDGAQTTGAIVLSPTPEAAEATQAAAVRWVAATGLDIVVAPGGVPISLAPGGVSAPGGYGVCAMTESDGNGPKSMRVDSDPPAGACRSLADTIAHEVGHVICRTYAPKTAEGECHTPTGLMRHAAQSLPRDSVLDASALDAICTVAPCTAFVPE